MHDCSILMEIKDWNKKGVDPTYATECPHCDAPLRDDALRCDICGWQLSRIINYKRIRMVMGMSLMTLEDLAKIFNISSVGVHHWVHGRSRINEQALEKLEETFNLPKSWFTVR